MATDTKNFKASEFACKCCGANKIDQRVMNMCQKIRDFLGVPVRINSGYRCAKHNAEVGGVKNSQHTLGFAADLSSSKSGLEIFLAVHELYVKGELPDLQYAILYLKKNFVHIDCGAKRNYMWEVRAS